MNPNGLVNCGPIKDWPWFHHAFAQAFGFPALYGNNMNAWTDCLTSLDAPEDGMTSVHCEPGTAITQSAIVEMLQAPRRRITAYDRPACFQDTLIQGAFRSMRHNHVFKALAPDRTEMEDCFVFAAPLPVLGVIAGNLPLRRYMRTLLVGRNEDLKRVAESDEWKTLLPSRERA